jgi:hypothetical protein
MTKISSEPVVAGNKLYFLFLFNTETHIGWGHPDFNQISNYQEVFTLDSFIKGFKFLKNEYSFRCYYEIETLPAVVGL